MVKVKKDILPPTHLPAHQAPVHPQQQEIPSCPQEEQLKTSLAVQPDGMMERHRDGEHNPLERLQVSEDQAKVVADGTSSTDQGGDFVFQIEVGMDHEPSQVTARHFELTMFRQQQETTKKSTNWRGEYCLSPGGLGALTETSHVISTPLPSKPGFGV